MIKHYLLAILDLFLIVGCLVTFNEYKSQADRRYATVVKAFEQTQEALNYQQSLIDQYKRDCENITSKVINGEW